MKKIKTITAYAIVKKRDLKLDAMNIYADKDLVLEKDEVVVKIEIRAI